MHYTWGMDGGGPALWARAGVLALALIAVPCVAPASAQSALGAWFGIWEQDPRPDSWRHNSKSAHRDRAKVRHGQGREKGKSASRTAEQAARQPTGPLLAIVSINEQRIHVYDRNGLIAQSAVSTGQRGYWTPTGIFSVLQKSRYHESNIYSAAPMPFMQRLTWSGIALHAGVVPGHPASHGCIRMTYAFAPKLWAMSRLGMRVIVAQHEIAPRSVTHALLPVPVMTPAIAFADNAGSGSASESLASATVETPRGAGGTVSDRPQMLAASVTLPKLEGPIERARAARKKAAADAAVAAKAVKPALEVARRTAIEAGKARTMLRRAQHIAAAAEARLLRGEAASRAANVANAQRFAAAEATARAAAEKARRVLADATALEATRSSEASIAAAAAKATLSAKTAATAALDAANRSTEPVSVLVSRKAKRLFVRQGGEPVFDALVNIRDPERPLGTHVFTAMALGEGGNTLRWIATTVPDADSGRIASSEALDRLDIPDETMTQIAQRAWVGASLIITDQPISRETGRGTDFIVLTK